MNQPAAPFPPLMSIPKLAAAVGVHPGRLHYVARSRGIEPAEKHGRTRLFDRAGQGELLAGLEAVQDHHHGAFKERRDEIRQHKERAMPAVLIEVHPEAIKDRSLQELRQKLWRDEAAEGPSRLRAMLIDYVQDEQRRRFRNANPGEQEFLEADNPGLAEDLEDCIDGDELREEIFGTTPLEPELLKVPVRLWRDAELADDLEYLTKLRDALVEAFSACPPESDLAWLREFRAVVARTMPSPDGSPDEDLVGPLDEMIERFEVSEERGLLKLFRHLHQVFLVETTRRLRLVR